MSPENKRTLEERQSFKEFTNRIKRRGLRRPPQGTVRSQYIPFIEINCLLEVR